MAQVTILVNGQPTVVDETTPGFFGTMGYQYVSGGPSGPPTAPVVPPGASTGQQVTIIGKDGNPVTVNETTPGLFGDMGYEYVSPTNEDAGTGTGDGTVNTQGAGNLSEDIAGFTIFNLPPEMWGSLVPALDPNSPEYQQMLDNISTAYYDSMMQMATAKTEQEKALATSNWNTLKDYIKQNLNVTLSDDARQGWNQIQGLRSQYAGAGVAGSGLEAETIDTYLKGVRSKDSAARSEATSQKEAQGQTFYTTYASSQEIKDFVAQNPEQAKKWGLVPSDEMRASLDFNTLKAKYPNMSDEEINKHRAIFLDENGNYRSSLYQSYLYGSTSGTQPGNIDTANITDDQFDNPINIPVNPSDTGFTDIEAAKKRFQELGVQSQNYQDYLKANMDFIPSNVQTQFIRWASDNNVPITADDVKGINSLETFNNWITNARNQQSEQTTPTGGSTGDTGSKTGDTSGTKMTDDQKQQAKDAASGLDTTPTVTSGTSDTPKKEETSPAQSPVVLNPEQIKSYYESQSGQAKPISPTDWYYQQIGK